MLSSRLSDILNCLFVWWECQVCGLWDIIIRRMWVMRFSQPVTRNVQIRRYKNVRRQQDPWCNRWGGLVQWCVVKLTRCSKRLLGSVFQPTFMFDSFGNKKFWEQGSIPLGTRKFENKVLFLWEQEILRTRFYSFGNKDMGLPDRQLPIFALTHSSDWLDGKKRCLAPPKCDWDRERCYPLKKKGPI